MAKTVFFAAAFCASTGAMLLTGHVAVVALWIGLWAFALRARTGTRGSGLLMFYVGFLLFYPAVLSVGTSVNEQAVIAACILGLGLLTEWRAAKTRAGGWIRFLLVAWFVWGILAYAPVGLKWLMVTVLKARGPDWLGDIFYETTALKTAGRTILAAASALLAIRALRTPDDFRAFQRGLFVAACILVVLSAAESLTSVHLIPTGYEADARRLAGFSMPDPNGYGRLLLLPTIFVTTFLLHQKARTPIWVWGLSLAAFASVALTMSRTTYVSLSAGTLVLLILNRARLRTIGVMAALAAAMAVVVLNSGLADAFAEGSERRTLGSIYTRLGIYRSIGEILIERPWFGMHPGGYLEGLALVGHRMPDQEFDYEKLHFETPHNMLLAVAVEYGIPMAAILVLTMATTVVVGLRTKRRIQSAGPAPWRDDLDVCANAAVALSVAYFVHGLTENGILDAVFFTLGLAVASFAFVKRASSPPGSAGGRFAFGSRGEF